MHFRITVLGTSSLRGDEGQLVQSVLRQPRRFALLVYLALETRSGPVNRDTVMGVFWPDSPQENARSALNQALHYLRRSLGPDAIRTHRDSLEVNDRVVSCDAAELLIASESCRWSDAAELFAGELLPGYFDSSPSADFEHWLDVARATIRGEAAKCAWMEAEAEEAAGHAAGAIVWARRACTWSAGGEVEVRRLMEMMARLGDRAGALEAFEALSRSLAEVDARPAPETRELLARLRARWAEEDRAAMPAHRPPLSAIVPAVATPSPTRTEGSRSRGPVRSLQKLSSALVTAGLMIAFLSLWAVTRAPTSAAPYWTTVVVEGLGTDEADATAAQMLRGAVVSQLQEISPLRVVEEADSAAIARERGFVVGGDLLRSGGDLQARFHLVDGHQGTVLASLKLEQPTAELPAALDEMARSVALFIRREVGAALDERRLVEADVPEEAITAVQLARQDKALGASLWRQRSAEAALAAYEKADSMFARGAAMAPHWDLPWIDRADIAYRVMWIQRLSDVGSDEAELEWVARGIQFADAAIARDDRHAASLEIRALLQEWQWLLSQPDPSGRSVDLLARAEEDARRATEIDPYNARAWNVLGATQLYRGAWAEAYWALDRAVRVDTDLENDAEIAYRLFTAAWETNNPEAARAWCDRLAERWGEGWPTTSCRMHLMVDTPTPDLGRVAELRRQAESWPYWPRLVDEFDALAAVLHARAGEEERAREILARLPATSTSSELPYLRAWALLELGEPEAARATLEAYIAASPATRSSLLKSRRFRRLARPE